MDTHDQLVKKLMRRPGVRAEVERIEREESALLDALLKARQEAGLTQGQVAARMGTHASAIARLERALASGKHSPSITTLRRRGKRRSSQASWTLTGSTTYAATAFSLARDTDTLTGIAF